MSFERTELSKFSEVGRAITRATGVAVEKWADGESGVILKRWAGATKVVSADRAAVEARYRAQKQEFGTSSAAKNPYRISVNTGRRDGKPGVVWWKNPRTGKFRRFTAGTVDDTGAFFPAHVHFRPLDWALISEGVEKLGRAIPLAKAAGLKAIGLARQSIVQMADQLGIALEAVKGGGGLSAAAIAQARGALASNGVYYENGSAWREKTATSYFVEGVNGYPMLRKLGMDQTLERIFRERLGESRAALERGVLESITKTKSAFPYLS